MNLKNRLEQMQGNVLVGCNRGSGFFFADDVSKAAEQIQALSDKDRQKKLVRCRKLFRQMLRAPDSRKELIKQQLDKADEDYKGYIPLLEREVIEDDLTPIYHRQYLIIDGTIYGDFVL